MITRICKICLQEKSLEELSVHKKCKYGVRQLCKKCHVAQVMEKTDPLKKAVYDAQRRSVKSAELRAYDKDRSKLPHRKALANEMTRRRRAQLRNAVPENYDRQGVMAMYKLAQKITLLTGVEMHVDHIQPLARGGQHNTDNLQLLAAPLNLAKNSGVKEFYLDKYLKARDFELDRKVYPA